MPIRIADLTTDYGNIGGQIANLGNQFFSGYNNARKMGMDQQRQQTLAELAESFKQGQDPDWRGAAQKLMGAGDVEGGLDMLKLGEAATQRRQAQQQSLATQSMLMGGGQPQAMRSSASGDPASAIAGIESGGRYDALGPVTRTGDRAYGKYQVMGANIPQWTRQYLGREMSPEEFIASPEAQDAVFQGEFGRLSQKHGPGGAARAWFAGEGGMNDPGRKDILGTTVADYGRKFSAAYGGGQQPMAAPDGTPIVQAQQPSAMPAQAPQRATSSLPPDDPFPRASNQQLMGAISDPVWGERAKMALQKRERYAEKMDARNAPTEAQKNYEAARRDGFQGTFFEYQRSMREKEVVSGESEENRAIGKKSGEAIAAMAEAAGSAPNNLSRLSRISTMMEQIGTGKLTPSRMTAAQWGRALGVSDDTLKGIGLDPRQAATGEALQAMINQLVVGQIGAGGFPANNFSDADRAFLVQTMPELSKDPRANEIVIEALRRTEQSKVDKAKAYREWKQANPKSTFFDFETEWSDKQASVNKMDDLSARASQLIQGGNPQMPEENKIGASVAPQVGTVSKGYRFKGGDPANQASWEKVN
jgi:hypothetical protein